MQESFGKKVVIDEFFIAMISLDTHQAKNISKGIKELTQGQKPRAIVIVQAVTAQTEAINIYGQILTQVL